MKYFIRCFALLLVSLLWCVPARAQKKAPPIQMAVSSPMAIQLQPLLLPMRTGRWFPIAVTLSNTGDPVQGTLTLRLVASGGSRRAATEYFTEVDLPQTARKRVWLYGRVEGEDIDVLKVTFNGRGFNTLSAEGRFGQPEPARRTVLTVSDSDERLGFLGSMRGNGLAIREEVDQLDPISREQVARNPIRALGASREMLPDRWIGYDIADVVVLQNFSHASLTTEQIAALRGYVAAGGTLLALGGSDWQRLAQSPLADLWPLTPQSSGPAPGGEISGLVSRYIRKATLSPGDRLGGAPVVVTRGVLKPDARRVLGATGEALDEMSFRPQGAGNVLLLNFDLSQPPFVGWDGQARLWARIFAQTPSVRRVASVAPTDDFAYNTGYTNYQGQVPDSATASLRRELETAPQLRTPPVSYIVWFLALYVFCLVPVNYVVLRYFDKREWAWVTIPIIVVIFSGISYAAALNIKGSAILTRQVNLVQGSAGTGMARVDSMLWLFSPRRAAYTVKSNEPSAVVADYIGGEQDSGVSLREPDPRQSFEVSQVPIKMWDSKLFVGHGVAGTGRGLSVTPPVNGQLDPSRDYAIRNGTPYNLRGVVLVSGRQAWFYGDIKANGSASKPNGKNQRADSQGMLSLLQQQMNAQALFPSSVYNNTSAIANSMLALTLSGNRLASGPFLLGWSDELPVALDIGEQAPRAQKISLFLFRL